MCVTSVNSPKVNLSIVFVMNTEKNVRVQCCAQWSKCCKNKTNTLVSMYSLGLCLLVFLIGVCGMLQIISICLQIKDLHIYMKNSHYSTCTYNIMYNVCAYKYSISLYIVLHTHVYAYKIIPFIPTLYMIVCKILWFMHS